MLSSIARKAAFLALFEPTDGWVNQETADKAFRDFEEAKDYLWPLASQAVADVKRRKTFTATREWLDTKQGPGSCAVRVFDEGDNHVNTTTFNNGDEANRFADGLMIGLRLGGGCDLKIVPPEIK
jgi:hypothetical protein